MGNICRSPAGEAVFLSRLEETDFGDQVVVDSAGTIGYHRGDRADSRMRAAASARGYSLDSRARRIEVRDFEDFDLVVTMDDANYRDVRDIDPGNGARVVKMCEYCSRHDETEVPDPYYGGARGFETVLDILEDACGNLLEQLNRS